MLVDLKSFTLDMAAGVTLILLTTAAGAINQLSIDVLTNVLSFLETNQKPVLVSKSLRRASIDSIQVDCAVDTFFAFLCLEGAPSLRLGNLYFSLWNEFDAQKKAAVRQRVLKSHIQRRLNTSTISIFIANTFKQRAYFGCIFVNEYDCQHHIGRILDAVEQLGCESRVSEHHLCCHHLRACLCAAPEQSL